MTDFNIKAQRGPGTPAPLLELAQRLTEARLEKGLSQEEAADKLYLTVRAVTCMEEAKFDELPGVVYVKGYLRSYAELLDLPVEEILGMYESTLPKTKKGSAQPPSPTHMDDAPEPSHGDGRSRKGVIGLVALVILVLLVLSLSLDGGLGALLGSSSEPTPALAAADAENGSATPGQASAPQPQQAAPAPQPGSSPPRQQATGRCAIRGPAGALSSPPFDKEVEVNRSFLNGVAQITVDAGGCDQIRLTFTDRCWVGIKDASRPTSIYSAVGQAGEAWTVLATAPVNVIIGQANAAQITYNGQPVDTAPYVRQDGTVRVALDE